MSFITTNIKNITTELRNLAAKYKLKKAITLVAVTKGVEPLKIEEAILSGVTNFGENYLQEALTKWPFLKEKYPHLKLHFIGGIQSNKLKGILQLFDVLQSIDSFTLIDKAVKLKTAFNKEFYIEVKASDNINNNERKGVTPLLAKELIKYAITKGLNLKGLMGVAPKLKNSIMANEQAANNKIEQFFKQLQQLQQELSLPELSMGMSNDYNQAIKYGATMVRLGSKIFKNI